MSQPEPSPSPRKDIVLAFSGGLDTSFCMPYLKERGWAVHTVFADTGGVDAEERAYIEARAHELGVASHVTVDGGPAIWKGFVKPFVWAGEGYQGQYPLLVSDRYLIVDAAIARAQRTRHASDCAWLHRHGQRPGALRSRGQGAGRLRDRRADPRDPEGAHRSARLRAAVSRRAWLSPCARKQKSYTINENLLGLTMSGGEIDRWEAPGEGARGWCAQRADWPAAAAERDASSSSSGEAVALNGERLAGHELLAQLNRDFAQYGVGRGLYTGDTTIGLKGRIIFEAPGLIALLTAHRALEEAVLTKQQNRFKPDVARKWVELVYEGFFHDPLKTDLEAFLASSQALRQRRSRAADERRQRATRSRSSRRICSTAKGATYAQSADWGVAEAEGFIRLYGMSSTLWAQVNRK